jgi:predicted nucleotidyltransferase component of viral defense system
LKKCYFKNYRFSEDLDFTLLDADFVVTENLIQPVCNRISENISILFSPVKISPLKSNNQHVGYTTKIKFWGANHKRNQQPTPYDRWMTSIKVEIISYETMVDAPDFRSLYDDFSDSFHFEGIKIPCYSISEIVAEKFRALLQRSYSAPRDYYDLWYILREKVIDWEKVIKIFEQKMIYKGLEWNGYQAFFNEKSIREMTREWNNSLKGHIRDGELPDVEIVLSELKSICEKVSWTLPFVTSKVLKLHL